MKATTQPISFQILSTHVFLVDQGYNILKTSPRLLKKGDVISLIQTPFTARVAVGTVVEPDGCSDFQDIDVSKSDARLQIMNQRFYIKLLANKPDYLDDFQTDYTYNQVGTFEVKVAEKSNASAVYNFLTVEVLEPSKWTALQELSYLDLD